MEGRREKVEEEEGRRRRNLQLKLHMWKNLRLNLPVLLKKLLHSK